MNTTTRFTKRKQALMLISAVLLIATIVVANTSLLTLTEETDEIRYLVHKEAKFTEKMVNLVTVDEVHFNVANLQAQAEKESSGFNLNNVVLASEEQHTAKVAAQKNENAMTSEFFYFLFASSILTNALLVFMLLKNKFGNLPLRVVAGKVKASDTMRNF